MSDFKVKAILRTDKRRQDGLCPIYLKVTIKGKSTKLPAGIAASPQEWITATGMFKEAPSSVRNCVVKKKVAAIEIFLWKQLAADIDLTLKMVRQQFAKQKTVGFYSLVDECYEMQFRIISEGTKAHYRLVRKRLTEFQKSIVINEINVQFLLRFENFLKGKGVGVSGIATHHKILRVIINYGIKHKLIQENPYADFKVHRGKPRTATLTSEQIRALQALVIKLGKNKLNKGLELTRDLFLFSCYTALRFGYVTKLTHQQIVGRSHLLVEQGKTGSLVHVPLLSRSLELIDKYALPGRVTIFPDIKNQTANRHLKRIAQMCSIETNVHFHLSRHSFGNVMANSGVNAITLSKLMGHSSMRTTMIYVNSQVDSVREQMSRAIIFD